MQLKSIPILFENDDLLAVEKPIGVATVFERKKEADCLIEMLRESTGLPLMVVHRLDKDVSGVVVFAKNPQAHRTLNMQFDRREVHKTYEAVLHGELAEHKGVVQKPIRQFGSGRMGVDEIKGKESVTRFAVRTKNERFTYALLMPDTGRRHQLRVHAYSLGHPIVGDPLYGDRAVQKEFPRLMLHAARIEFSWRGESLTVQSVVPESFTNFFSE